MEDLEREMLRNLVGEGRVGGRYLVERVLGLGGMGVVAAARYPELDQEVAIKFMRPQLALDATLSARFLREAKLAARAKSPHFVRVFDFGKLDNGVPYLVMEMLSGRDLAAELRDLGPLPLDQAVDYVLQAALGLAELHALGVVHRDLKPSNLFIAEAAGTRTLKVLDLGLTTDPGKSGGHGLTSTGHVFGTPHYMSPEQIKESRSVDPRSDVWALGVILYELLTGSLPFGQGSESTGEVFGLILHTEAIPLREQRPALPEEIQAIVHRCLARSPDDRYANLGELAAALAPLGGPAAADRAEAVRKALAAKPEPVRPTPVEAEELSSAATVQVSEDAAAQAALAAPPALHRTAEVQMHTGTGPFAKATSAPQPPRPEVPSRRGIIAAAIVLAVALPIVAIALRTRGQDDVPAARASSSSAPSAVATDREAARVAPPPATLASSPVDTASVAPAASSASSAPASSSATQAAPVASSPARPLRPASAPGRPGTPAATAAPPRGTSVLDGLDRK